MRGRVSSRARRYVQARATAHMYSTCIIERVGAPVFSDVTGIATAGARVQIYEGVCRIWEVSGAQPLAVGEDTLTLQSTNLSIPWDVEVVPRRDDEIEITSSLTDADLVYRRYRILDVVKGGDIRATRRFNVQGIQDSKDWHRA